jgi:cardiolipin synthase
LSAEFTIKVDSKQVACALIRYVRIVVAAALLAACASNPTPPPTTAVAPVKLSEIRVEDEHGPLTTKRAVAAVRTLDSEGEGLARYLAEVDLALKAPLVLDNDAHLLIDGPQTQAAMLREIGMAQKKIDLQTYILESDGIGAQLAELLMARRSEGLVVRVLYDSVGSVATPVEYFNRLKQAGIAVCEFNPVNPLKAAAEPELTINNRAHRKLLIVDQRVAFTGGLNISNVYSTPSSAPGGSKPNRDSGWRDTHVIVRGPVVDEFQSVFDDSWTRQHCPQTDRPKPPPSVRAGHMAMRIVVSNPLDERSELYTALLAAIAHARSRIWLTYGYFVPDERLLDAIEDAARRGVDVRLVLPGFSDFWATFHAGRSRYSELLSAGVRLFERRDALLHAKTAVIDGVWASVGSTNLDWRSFVHNYEADVLILDRDFGREMEQLFNLDVSASHEVSESEWRDRGLRDRFLEWLARRWEYFL